MLITTMIFYRFVRDKWRWPTWKALLVPVAVLPRGQRVPRRQRAEDPARRLVPDCSSASASWCR
jgi:hypothetical protein